MEKNKLSKYEAICFLLITIITEIILNISQSFLSTVGTGSIINLIVITIIAFIFCILLNNLFKNFSNSDILNISEFLGGKILKFIIGAIYILFFIFVISYSISNFCYLIKTIYFPNSPILFIILFFIIAILISNLIGFNSIKKVACIVVPLAIISIIFLFFNSLDNSTFYRISPLLGENSNNTFVSGLSNLFVFNIILYFYFLMPLLKKKNDFPKITKYTLFISFIILLFTIISLLSKFPLHNQSEEINTLYLLTRSVEIGDFLQRVDALFILLWIICIFTYTSIILFLILQINKKLFKLQNEKILSFPYSFISLGLGLFLFNNNYFGIVETNLYKYLLIFMIFGLGFIILLLANIKNNLKK